MKPGTNDMKSYLPFPPTFTSEGEYIDSLIDFVSLPLFKTLVGGIHILDFFTGEIDQYDSVLDADWRTFFDTLSVDDILDMILRKPLESFENAQGQEMPQTLLQFIKDVRRHQLDRLVVDETNRSTKAKQPQKLKRNLVVGMSDKKAHEVEHFTSYVASLLEDIQPKNGVSALSISHLVDFGSGLSYLSRALASEPHNHDVVAIESKKSNIDAGKALDIRAKLPSPARVIATEEANLSLSTGKKGSIQYVEKILCDGDLTDIITNIDMTRNDPVQQMDHGSQAGVAKLGNVELPATTLIEKDAKYETTDPQLMVISLHSCGNLIHYALRALLQNDAVKAVAVIGCCYNLMTERIGVTFKPPYQAKQAMIEESPNIVGDPDGFPISQRLTSNSVSLNITARMMACQAPYNWTSESSSNFFKRHFYRALLQRILLDKGVLDSKEPVIIGSLKKKSYLSFYDYVHDAVEKILVGNSTDGRVKDRIRSADLHNIDQKEVEEYEVVYSQGLKHLSIIWTLMAFCAGCVESLIVVDRYMFLKESGVVRDIRIEPAFDYHISPRNLVIVGIK